MSAAGHRVQRSTASGPPTPEITPANPHPRGGSGAAAIRDVLVRALALSVRVIAFHGAGAFRPERYEDDREGGRFLFAALLDAIQELNDPSRGAAAAWGRLCRRTGPVVESVPEAEGDHERDHRQQQPRLGEHEGGGDGK
jgi:hypothetical protein